VLPPCDPESGERVTLGEGWTPLIEQPCLRERLGVAQLWVKDESLNPTGTFKARGLSVAVSMAKKLGAKSLALPSAGNAAGALAAYAARAGLEATVVMPADTPEANILECRGFGAKVVLLDGLISKCAKYLAENKDKEGWFDVSTLKEPYRVEGKKTMAYELFEQIGALPDVIVYPTGGGVGLIGMWKAFEEMEGLGWIGPERPRMVSVQAAGCAPIVQAFDQHAESTEFWENAATLASGLRVPKAFGDWLILQTLYASSGTAVAVSDEEILQACREVAEAEGIFAAPEGAACWSALKKLRQSGWLQASDRVAWFNTGSGYKYLEVWTQAARGVRSQP
jgi:threonine synthase